MRGLYGRIGGCTICISDYWEKGKWWQNGDVTVAVGIKIVNPFEFIFENSFNEKFIIVTFFS